MASDLGWVTDFVALMAGEEVTSLRVEEAMALKHRNLPKRIYKFRCDSNNSRDNLRNDTVWLSSPDSFNDPYDCSIKISFNSVIRDVISRYIDELLSKQGLRDLLSIEDIEAAKSSDNPPLKLAELIEKIEPITVPQNKKTLFEFMGSLVSTYEREMANGIGQNHKRSLKLCSFSEINDSIIMWSHYGDHHRGFCIEYCLEGLSADDLNGRFLCPVIYSAKLFDATRYYRAAAANPKEFNNIFPLLASLYKSPEWRYEREWRLVVIANLVREESNWRMVPAKSLFLGALMPADKKEELIDIAYRKGLEVFQMHLAKDSFELVPEPIAGQTAK